MDLIAFFWNADRPIGSIIFTLFTLMITYSCVGFAKMVMRQKKLEKLFPGPPAELLMGNMPDMDKHGGFGLAFFKEMHAKYGPVFGFFMPFGDYHISIDRPEALQIVHKKAPERPDSTFKVVNYLFKENILFQHGAWQKQLRRSYQEIINDPSVHQKLHRIAGEQLDTEIKSWAGSEVDVYTRFEGMIYDIMGQVLFGQTWSELGVGKRIMKNHTFCAHNVMKWAFLPWSPVWNQDYKDYVNAKQGFWDDISMMLKQRKKELDEGAKIDPDNKDVFSLLLLAKKEDGSQFYDHRTAVATMCVFLNGAFDTTLNSTTWTLYWLAKHPDTQQKLQAELDKSFPELKKGVVPAKEDLAKLHYLDAVIRESMRRMPAAPINMRVNLEGDYSIPDIGTIPKGITVICPYENSMMKEDVFGADCPHFNPERFMGDGEKVKQCRQMWTPFGDHTRMCVGRNFAMVEIRLFLATILSKFTFTLKDPDQKIGTLYEAGINVINPKPLFIFKAR